MRICIVGGGIIGLTTGLYLSRKNRDMRKDGAVGNAFDVTIVTDRTTPDTTADGAAGIWGPYLLTDTPAELQYRWCKETHDFIEGLWNTPGGGKDMGISLMSSTRINPGDKTYPPHWSDIVYGFRDLTRDELDAFGSNHGKHKRGCEFVTYILEPIKFLPHVAEEFRRLGGRLVVTGGRRVDDLARVGAAGAFDLVVNCTGVWAGRLTGDDKITPYRGQVMRLRAPWVKRTVLDDEGNYVISNQDSVVFGGTHQVGDWNTTPDPADSEYIREGCKGMMPADARGAEHIKDWVGLRPGRAAVRLERGRVRHPTTGRDIEVIHNYGHGGAGITVFWGCAKDVFALVEEVRREMGGDQDRIVAKL